MDDSLGRNREECLEMFDPVQERLIGPIVVEVADVVTEEGIASPRQGEGILHLAAAGQERYGHRSFQLDRQRCIAAGAAQEQLTA